MTENADKIERCKGPLFNLLLAAFIARVEVEFDGSGDEGQIQFIDFQDSDGDSVPIDHCTMAFDGGPDGNITEYVEQLCYAVLEETGMDWYNNAGGQGTITLNTLSRTIFVNIGINFSHNYVFEY